MALIPRPRRPRRLIALAAVLLLGAGPAATVAQTPTGAVVRTAEHDSRIETVVDALVHPFAMAFTPDGNMLITERPGRLRIVRKGVLLQEPVAGLPGVLYLGHGATSQDGREQAGMRDVVLHPDFATNRLLYISYVRTRRERLRQSGHRARPLRARPPQ